MSECAGTVQDVIYSQVTLGELCQSDQMKHQPPRSRYCSSFCDKAKTACFTKRTRSKYGGLPFRIHPTFSHFFFFKQAQSAILCGGRSNIVPGSERPAVKPSLITYLPSLLHLPRSGLGQHLIVAHRRIVASSPRKDPPTDGIQLHASACHGQTVLAR